MQVRLLGPVDVLVDGAARPVRGVRRKAVLAALALHPGEFVRTGRLAEVVWGEAAPQRTVNTLQHHVAYLRGAMGSKTAITACPPGYRLDLGAEATDVMVAERLIRQGIRPGDGHHRARYLRAALALWRGRPLEDVTGLPWLEEQAGRLDQLWLQASRALIEARMQTGEHVQLIPELTGLAAGHPFDEQIHGQLVLALYRAGRQADALTAFGRLRHTLSTELGIDPSQPLRDLQAAILRQDPALGPGPLAITFRPASAMAPVPAQLPAPVPAFVGRGDELAMLDSFLREAARPAPAGPAPSVISALSGTAGVGKTTLAVQWAHRVSAQFPDGQLYVNLRGFDPGGQVVDPGTAVRGFLDAFGVAVARIPAGLPAQVGLYRSLLAGKRVLVVLDNARDAEQVRPLLPGSPGCLAIVTSRNHLTGLVATEGACPLTLDLLTAADARDLLARRLGEGRVASEPDAVEEIVGRCARLPLALAIAASRAATNPGFPLAVIAAELREASRALDPFDGGDRATDVRAVFSWSYQAVSADAARLFRLLGLQPGPDIAAAAAASLAAIPPEQARALLAELSRAHLLAEPSSGRYAFHDLLRAYATELAHEHDSRDVRHAAVRGVLDHYLHTAHGAAMLMEPYFDPIALGRAQPAVIVGELATAEDALCWFTAEHATLLAAVDLAAAAGFGAHTWQLAWTLNNFLLRRGLWDEQAMALNTGLAAARRLGDTAGQVQCLQRLAWGYAKSGRAREAWPLFQQVLQQSETIGDHASQAYIHGSLGWLAASQQRPADALSHSLRALDLYRTADHPGLAMMLNDVGCAHAVLGNHQEALTYCEQALAAVRELGARNWECAVWDSLGYIHHQLGTHQEAIVCYERSIDISRELADRYSEATTLDRLGDAHNSAGGTDAARRAWTHALRIFHEIDHPDGGPIRAKLRSPPARPPSSPPAQTSSTTTSPSMPGRSSNR